MMDLGMTNADGSKKLIKVQREATTDESITVSRVHRTEIDHPRVRHPVVAEKHLRAHMGGDLTTYFDKPKNIHAETWSLIESGDHEKALKLHTAHHEGDHAQVRTIKSTIRRHHTRHARAKAAAVKAQAKKEADMGKSFASAMNGVFKKPEDEFLPDVPEYPDCTDKLKNALKTCVNLKDMKSASCTAATKACGSIGPHGDAESVPFATEAKADCEALKAEPIPKDIIPDIGSKAKPKKVSLRLEHEEDAEVGGAVPTGWKPTSFP